MRCWAENSRKALHQLWWVLVRHVCSTDNSVIGAYQSGALPLNTLANAILAKNDQMRNMAAVQYEEQARESVVRPRGIQ